MQDEILKDILTEIKSLRKLLEGAFGVQADSIQQLGVVDNPAAKVRLSISKNDGVMLEEEKNGQWGNSGIKNICGRLASLTTRISTEGEYKGTLYGYLEIHADQTYSIRFNTAKTFGRLLISSILFANYEQLAGVMTLSVSAGTRKKTVRIPNLLDSFGFRVEGAQIPEDDWVQNRESYIEQAATKIKAARSNTPSLSSRNNIQAIAPSNTIDIPHQELTEEEHLQKQVIAKAKEFWGEKEFKTKGAEYSARHFGGKKTGDMTIADLQKYLQGLEGLIQAKKEAV
jgi:hypothetical protein